MSDAFRAVVLRERITKAGALLALVGIVGSIAYLEFGTVVTNGRVVKAEVLRVGTRAAARTAGGDLPIVTVRLPDGSVRQVQATWADVHDCKPGRPISLLQHGPALQIGRPGCITGD
jgi:hypothetical protein